MEKIGNEPLLIALVGYKQSGKSTVASHLGTTLDFTPIKFAGPLKKMVGTLLYSLGFDTPEEQYRFLEGSDKETTIPSIGKSSRELQQTLGTEWGRELVHPSVWLKCFENTVDNLRKKYLSPVICDDCRFLNEAKLIRKMGGKIVRISRFSANDSEDTHLSETEMVMIQEDYNITNNGTIEDLENEIDKILEEIQNG